MKFISFFAGIGGIDLGLERAGHECVGQVEIDPYCQRVLAKHWPHTWRHDDILTLEAEDIPDADLWTGGFPCQDISNAGKRAGIHGERSGLFFDFMRLVRQVRPEHILLENVAALLSSGMGDVLACLAEGGYDAEWECIPAASVGAPHIRDRLFVLAYAVNMGREAGSGKQGDETKEGGRGSQSSRSREVLAYAPGWGKQPRGPQRNERRLQDEVLRAGWHKDDWMPEPAVGRVAHGVPSRVDRLRALGNAVVPHVAEYIGRLLKEAGA